MSNLVIVAIPAEDDIVWKVSSEKVPHMTLLFMGDADAVSPEQSQRITEFLEHAVSVQNKGPFYLDVDYRGKLGVDDADVLYFDKGWDSKIIEQLRGWLLQNTDIKTLVDAAPQFEGWTPHLTLGYPETPAKKVPDFQDRFYSVKFDRIALWFGDYEGPEFRLKREYTDQDMTDLGVGWSDETVETGMSVVTQLLGEGLEHHGVLGMKWGVRRERNAEIAIDTAKKVAPVVKRGGAAIKRGAKRFGKALDNLTTQMADSSWEHSVYDDAKHEEVHNKVSKDLEDHILRLQTSPKYRGKNLRTDSDLRKSYYEDVAKVTDSSYKRAVKDTYGENYSGTKSVHYVHDARGPRLEIRDKKTGMPEQDTPLLSKREIEQKRATEALNNVLTPEQKQRLGGAGGGTSQFGHADGPDAPDIFIDIVLDDNGFISGVKFVTPSDDTPGDALAQTMELGELFLEHYGVKGMRWGVRKDSAAGPFSATSKLIEKNRAAVEADRRSKRSPVETKATDHIGPTKFNKTKIKTKGGEDHPAHEDALNTAKIEQKLKKSGPAALSNQELRTMNERLQLEQNTARLVSERKGNGQGFVRRTLKRHGQQQIDRSTQKIFNKAGDKALEEAERRATEKLSNR